MKRIVSSRQSLPVMGGAVVLAAIALMIVRTGNQAVDVVTANERRDVVNDPEHRQLVTIRVGAKWKLGHTSWGPVEPKDELLPVEEEPDPLAKKFEGLDIGVTGR